MYWLCVIQTRIFSFYLAARGAQNRASVVLWLVILTRNLASWKNHRIPQFHDNKICSHIQKRGQKQLDILEEWPCLLLGQNCRRVHNLMSISLDPKK